MGWATATGRECNGGEGTADEMIEGRVVGAAKLGSVFEGGCRKACEINDGSRASLRTVKDRSLKVTSTA
eukprot:scaffold81173_cov41-Tisochrysis_lutea.AAC.1